MPGDLGTAGPSTAVLIPLTLQGPSQSGSSGTALQTDVPRYSPGCGRQTPGLGFQRALRAARGGWLQVSWGNAGCLWGGRAWLSARVAQRGCRDLPSRSGPGAFSGSAGPCSTVLWAQVGCERRVKGPSPAAPVSAHQAPRGATSPSRSSGLAAPAGPAACPQEGAQEPAAAPVTTSSCPLCPGPGQEAPNPGPRARAAVVALDASELHHQGQEDPKHGRLTQVTGGRPAGT